MQWILARKKWDMWALNRRTQAGGGQRLLKPCKDVFSPGLWCSLEHDERTKTAQR